MTSSEVSTLAPTVSSLPFQHADAGVMDCVDDNLSMLLLARGAASVRAAFACEWVFEHQAGALCLRRSTSVARVRRLCGIDVEASRLAPESALEVVTRDAQQTPLLLFGDAYFMPWLPYFGEDHVDHSFVVDAAAGGQLRVVDAYHNRTEWGDARPLSCWVPAAALSKMLWSLPPEDAGACWRLGPSKVADTVAARQLLQENLDGLRGVADKISEFSRYHRERHQDAEHAKQLVLDCWLISRSRALHGRWLAELTGQGEAALPPGFAARFEERVVGGWQRAGELAYLLWRRVRSAKRPPTTCFDLFEREVASAEAEASSALASWLRS